jgi:hypothetical protein
MPDPHARNNCVRGQDDADMQAAFPRGGERSTLWCSRGVGEHFAGLMPTSRTVGETVAAFGQLAALGVTPARIARRSKTPPHRRRRRW